MITMKVITGSKVERRPLSDTDAARTTGRYGP